jgi:hypothetical protein
MDSRDLLSLLVRANMAETDAKRLSDDEMLARKTRVSMMILDGLLMAITYRNPDLSACGA